MSTLTFGAVGDISFAGNVGKNVALHGPDYPFEKMWPVLKRADVLFGNMESVTIPADFPQDKLDPGALYSRDDVVTGLKNVGFDMLNLAANHVLDCGSIGLEHTQKVINDAGIVTAGVGQAQQEARRLKIVEKNGITLGFLCYVEDCNWLLGQRHPGPAYYTEETILEDIEQHKHTVDILVVSIHGDLEFMETPSVPRMQTSRRIALAGPHLILEHHPHVPQGIEKVENCYIVYSLGNFLFDVDSFKNGNPHCAHSFVLFAEIDKAGVQSIERVPFSISGTPEYRPHPLSGKERDELIEYFHHLDELLKDKELVGRNWREITLERLKWYWAEMQKIGPEEFFDELAWRLFQVAENRSWTSEILKISEEKYKAIGRKTASRYTRPNYEYQRREKH